MYVWCAVVSTSKNYQLVVSYIHGKYLWLSLSSHHHRLVIIILNVGYKLGKQYTKKMFPLPKKWFYRHKYFCVYVRYQCNNILWCLRDFCCVCFVVQKHIFEVDHIDKQIIGIIMVMYSEANKCITCVCLCVCFWFILIKKMF